MQINSLMVSYLSLRKLIGFLGFTFPFILIVGGFISGVDIQTSVSYYYHTAMHDIFVAVLCIVATFLFAYKGYAREDEIVGKVASLCTLGVALLPTTIKTNPTFVQEVVGMLHLVCAAGYFLAIAYFCLRLFPKTHSSIMTQKKIQRNFVYRVSGITILLCLLCIGVYSFLPSHMTQSVEHLNPVFWLESIGIIAFGFSWLVKGEALLKDEKAA